MILQTDRRLGREINKYGCYLMSLLWHVSRLNRRSLDIPEILRAYSDAVARGLMERNCYIREPGGIMTAAGLPAVYTNAKEPPDRTCGQSEVEVLCFERPRDTGGVWRHFVAGDGQGHVTYDPMGFSKTVALGRLVSKRIFKVPAAAMQGQHAA